MKATVELKDFNGTEYSSIKLGNDYFRYDQEKNIYIQAILTEKDTNQWVFQDQVIIRIKDIVNNEITGQYVSTGKTLDISFSKISTGILLKNGEYLVNWDNYYYKAEVLDKKINDEIRSTIHVKEVNWYYSFDRKTGTYLNVFQSEVDKQSWKTNKDNYIRIKDIDGSRFVGDSNIGSILDINFESISKGIKIPNGSFVVNLDGYYLKATVELKDFNGTEYSSIRLGDNYYVYESNKNKYVCIIRTEKSKNPWVFNTRNYITINNILGDKITGTFNSGQISNIIFTIIKDSLTLDEGRYQVIIDSQVSIFTISEKVFNNKKYNTLNINNLNYIFDFNTNVYKFIKLTLNGTWLIDNNIYYRFENNTSGIYNNNDTIESIKVTKIYDKFIKAVYGFYTLDNFSYGSMKSFTKLINNNSVDVLNFGTDTEMFVYDNKNGLYYIHEFTESQTDPWKKDKDYTIEIRSKEEINGQIKYTIIAKFLDEITMFYATQNTKGIQVENGFISVTDSEIYNISNKIINNQKYQVISYNLNEYAYDIINGYYIKITQLLDGTYQFNDKVRMTFTDIQSNKYSFLKIDGANVTPKHGFRLEQNIKAMQGLYSTPDEGNYIYVTNLIINGSMRQVFVLYDSSVENKDTSVFLFDTINNRYRNFNLFNNDIIYTPNFAIFTGTMFKLITEGGRIDILINRIDDVYINIIGESDFLNYLIMKEYIIKESLVNSYIYRHKNHKNNIIELDITDFDGSDIIEIKYFTNLKLLNCHGTQITKLDVTNNIELKYFVCNNTQISELDVTNNTQLEHLHCFGTQITKLDVTNNIELKYFVCNNTQISELDVTNNTQLEELYCNNTQISVLDVTKNIELKYFVCNNTQISELDVTNNTQLEELWCFGTQITKLDVTNSTKLKYLDCCNINITKLDVTKNIELKYLYCSQTQISELDVTNNTQLEELWCNNTQISELDLRYNKELIDLKLPKSILKITTSKDWSGLIPGDFNSNRDWFINNFELTNDFILEIV